MIKRNKGMVKAISIGVSIFVVLCLGGLAAKEAFAQGQIFIYPKEGQDEEQQKKDKYECHMWAVEQTGFDPQAPVQTTTQSQGSEGQVARGAARGAALGAIGGAIAGDPGKGAAVGAAVGGTGGAMRRRSSQQQAQAQAQQQEAERQQQQANFDRAYKTCLEGRDYTVK